MKITINITKKQAQHILNCDALGDACSYWQEIGDKIKKKLKHKLRGKKMSVKISTKLRNIQQTKNCISKRICLNCEKDIDKSLGTKRWSIPLCRECRDKYRSEVL